MAYRDFTLATAKATFDLILHEDQSLFEQIDRVPPSEILSATLKENLSLAVAIGSEKARSEFIIAPVLSEIRRKLNYQIGLFSGTEFAVEPAQGLTGFCDFILSASKEQYFISAPVLMVVEAKKENIIGGLGQCAAAMVGAQIFNQRAGNAVSRIYGVVTSGTNWKFLYLEANAAFIDPIEYHISQVDQVLGILLQPFQLALTIGSA
jgi:hypothetical protein